MLNHTKFNKCFNNFKKAIKKKPIVLYALLILLIALSILSLLVTEREKEIYKRNISIYIFKIKPRISYDSKKIETTCYRETHSTAKYDAYFEETKNKCREENGKIDGGKILSIYYREGLDDCVDRYMAVAPSTYIKTPYTCLESVKDGKWFWFLNHRLIKISE